MIKYLIFLILIVFVLKPFFTKSCPLDPICAEKSFPYHFCDPVTHNKVKKCSNNPNMQFNENNELLLPLRNKPCFHYNSESYFYEFKEIEKTRIVKIDYSYVIGTTTDAQGNTLNIYGYYNDSYHDGIIYSNPGDILINHNFKNGDPITFPYFVHKTETYIAKVGNDQYFDENGNLIFDRNHVETEMLLAQMAWEDNCIGCEKTRPDEINNCCFEIFWKHDDRDFLFDPFTGAEYSNINPEITPMFTFTNPDENCKLKCNQTVIYINQTRAFRRSSNGVDISDQRSDGTFFKTEPTTPNWKAYSLQYCFMHEFGHAFGFAEQYDGGGVGVNCATLNSVMNNTDVNMTSNNPQLSPEDICMYKKMYCWNGVITEIDEQISNETAFSLAPNPSFDNEIKLTITNKDHENLDFEIFDFLGNKHFTGSVLDSENFKVFQTNELTSGIYFLKISGKHINEIKKFTVQK